MHNADLPNRAELPTTRQLVRSTLIALAAAVALLATIVLPAEYAIDPTGVGRVLGLTQMGEIKMQLAEEAALDAERSAEAEPPALAERTPAVEGRSDEMTVTLSPGEGAEVKLVMDRGAQVQFEWTVQGGVVNYDLHGDGRGNSTSYQQGRGVGGHQGTFEAGFDGNHGWFWRNRGTADVTIVLRTRGAYTDIRRVI